MVKGADQVRHAITQRSFRDSKGFAASRSTLSSRTEEIIYATRMTFAAMTAVMAAKVELPMNASRSGERRGVKEVHAKVSHRSICTSSVHESTRCREGAFFELGTVIGEFSLS